jgi:lysophospholipase L1-like esterase
LPRSKRWGFTIVIALLSVLVVLVGSELTVRVYKKVTKIPSVRTFRENPFGTGSYRLKPNIDSVTKVGGVIVEVKTNSHGMGWREVSIEKPDNVRRIAFVGDSFTYGLWATTLEKTFVGVFDSLIPSDEYEVMNFGVSGYGLGDIELQIKEEILRFGVDDLFLMFYGGNDFIDTFLGVNKYDVKRGKVIPNKEVLDERVPPRLDEEAVSKKKPGLLRRFRKFLKSKSTLYRVLSKKKSRKIAKKFSVQKRFTSRTYWSQVPYPPAARNAKEVSLETLDRIYHLCEKEGIRLIIAAIPFKEQVYSLDERGKNYDIHLPQRFVEEFAKERDIPYFDLLDIARNHVRKTGEDIYVVNELHFNDTGHDLIGRALVRWFGDSLGSGAGGERVQGQMIPSPVNGTTPPDRQRGSYN